MEKLHAMTVGSAGLVERDAELSVIQSVLSAATEGVGQVVIVEGEAGIGKTVLLDCAADEATRLGFRTLRARGGELEQEYSHHLALDLFGPLLRTDRELDERLVGLAAAARPIFQLGDSARADPIAARYGLYWLSVQLAEEQPLLLLIDDGHWGDDPSLAFVRFLARRVAGLPVAVLVAMRPASHDEPSAVTELRAERDARRLIPPRLSAAGVEQLLTHLGTPATKELVNTCLDVTRGNPLFVSELARQPQVLAAIGTGEPADDELARTIRARVGLLADDERRIAEAVALLGDAARGDRVARLAGVERGVAGAAIRRLVDGAILDRGEALLFVHPIVGQAVLGGIPPAVRGTMHREAGMLLAGEAAPPEAIGAQLLRSTPSGDARTVELLRDAARVAVARGSPQAAVDYLARALQEPPKATVRGATLAEIAVAESSIGGPAVERYREALTYAADDEECARRMLGLGHALIAAGDWPTATTTFRDGLRLIDQHGGQGDAGLADQLEAGYIAAAWISMIDRPEAETRFQRLLGAGSFTAPQRELIVSTTFYQAAEARGSANEVAARALAAVDGVPADELVRAGQTVELTTGVLFTTDALDEELAFLDGTIDAVARTGRIEKFGLYSYCRAWPRYIKGDLRGAATDAQAAIRAHGMGFETFFPAASAVLAYVMVELDDPSAAEAAIDAVDPAAFANRIDYAVFAPIARGRILLARGENAAAVRSFEAAGSAAATVRMRNPGPPDWRSWAAVALLRVGRRAEAQRVAAEGLEIARSWGARWPLAAMLRASGLAQGEKGGIELLQEAVDVARASPSRLEEARCLLELGAALRRMGARREARAWLTEGRALAHDLGARTIERRAADELKAAGGRPRRFAVRGSDSLTPAEHRVAELVAAGRTNRQAAEALFVTPKAIEYHLANVYRKLEIASRAQLSAALQASGPAE